MLDGHPVYTYYAYKRLQIMRFPWSQQPQIDQIIIVLT